MEYLTPTEELIEMEAHEQSWYRRVPMLFWVAVFTLALNLTCFAVAALSSDDRLQPRRPQALPASIFGDDEEQGIAKPSPLGGPVAPRRRPQS